MTEEEILIRQLRCTIRVKDSQIFWLGDKVKELTRRLEKYESVETL